MCRASFRVRAEILVLGRNIHLCHGLIHNIKWVGIYVWAAHKTIFYEGDLKWKVNWWLFILKMLRLWGSFQISGPGAQILSWVSTPQDKRRRRWRWWARPRTMPCPSPWIWNFFTIDKSAWVVFWPASDEEYHHLLYPRKGCLLNGHGKHCARLQWGLSDMDLILSEMGTKTFDPKAYFWKIIKKI